MLYSVVIVGCGAHYQWLSTFFSVVVVVHTPTVYQMSTTGVVQPANTTLLVCFLKY